MIEREEPERKQPKTIAAEAYLDALWTYILGLARAGVEELQDKPSAAETDGSQTYDYVQIPLDVTVNSHARAKRFTASLPRALLPLQREELNRRLQPLQKQMKMSAVPHPHYLVDTSVTLVITIMYLTKWQDNMLPTRLLQGHNLVSTIAGVVEKLQEEKPLMTREELLGGDHRQNLIKDFRQAKMDKHADFLFQSCLEKQAKERATPMLQKQEVDATLLDGWCQRQPSASSRRRATVAHRRRQRSMSNRAAEYEKRVQLHAALQSAVHCKQILAVAKIQATSRQERAAGRCFEHGDKEPSSTHIELVVADRFSHDMTS